MKVVKKTGLVPVKAVGSHPPYNTGETFGLPPTAAAKAVSEGKVTFATIPPDVETYDVPNPASSAKEGVKAAAKAPLSPGEVDIPPDWETRHHLVRLKLAQAIAGGEFPVPDGKKPVEVGDDIIRAELARRSPPEPAAVGDGAGGEGGSGEGEGTSGEGKGAPAPAEL